MLQILVPCVLWVVPMAQEPGALVVSGTVWVVEQGERRLPFGGTLQLCYGMFYGTESVTTELVAGTFRCELPADAEHPTVGRLTLEERDAACPEGELADVSRPVELEAHFLPESRVRVRIRATGQELDVCLFGPREAPRETQLPYLVPTWPEDCPAFGWGRTPTVEARAPGYAWNTVRVDLLAGGDFWIELVPAARLEVTVRMPAGAEPQNLRVSERDGNGRHSALAEHDGQVITFDALTPGRYRLDTSQTGTGTHALVDRESFELLPGETTRIVVDLAANEPSERARAVGTLVVDPSWGLTSDLRLQFWRPEQPGGRWIDERFVTPLPATEAGSFLWDAGELGLGRHFVSVEPFGWGGEIEVAPGAPPFELCVPAAMRCHVRLVDAETRAPLEASAIFWRGTRPGTRLPVPSQTVYRDEGAQDFEFTAPRGWIEVTPHVEGFAWKRHELELLQDPTDVTVALEPLCRIRVTLRDGERVIPFPNSVGPRAWSLDGVEQSCGRSWSGDAITLNLEDPGTYRITVPTVEGFLAVEPRAVQARRREQIDVVFQLVRAR